jgi:hypothetical protein
MKRTCAATLHHLIIACLIGGDEDDLGPKAGPSVLEKLHAVRSAASFLRVPEDHPLGFDMLSDQAGYCWPEGSFLV